MSKYFYSDGKEKNGPFSLDELKNEEINHETLIWYEGLEDWTPAKNIDKLDDMLKSIPPPITFHDINEVTVDNRKITTPQKNKKDNSLSRNIPFMLLLSFVAGLIINWSNLSFDAGEFIGLIASSLALLTGLPLLIVKITKWLSTNKKWDKKATKSAWIIQLILTFMSVYGSFL